MAYYIPRNVKGESRILFIFSVKALIFSAIGAVVGLIFYAIFAMLGMEFVGVIITVAIAGIGFAIGTFKVPDTAAFEITKKTGGENIDDVIKRYIKFKTKKGKLYTYGEVVNKNE